MAPSEVWQFEGGAENQNKAQKQQPGGGFVATKKVLGRVYKKQETYRDEKEERLT
jgi:hypothetical protein